jgi:protein prenyltransferase alpha subunit repeat containing protein 1
LSEGNLGVPQKVLFKCYVAAIAAFHQDRRQRISSDPDALLASTSVILLANPAYQTALNVRKRLVVQRAQDPTRELVFTSGLLSVHSCCKESILWHHRRWLLRFIYAERWEDGEEQSVVIPIDVLRKEIEIVFKAGELYRRNYHAWNHLQFCFRSLRLCADSPSLPSRQASVTFLDEVFRRLKHWLELHVSDYSAAHHLCVLLQKSPDFRSGGIPPFDLDTLHVESLHRKLIFPSIVEHGISLVSAYPARESLWMYLRGAYALQAAPAQFFPSKILTCVGVPETAVCAVRFLFWAALEVRFLFLWDC